MMRMIFDIIKNVWGDSPTHKKLLFCCLAAVGLIAVGWVLYVTAEFWLPLLVVGLVLTKAVWDAVRQASQRQECLRLDERQESVQRVLGFVQWFFCRSQRDRLGIKAIPLTASLAYLTQHTKTEETNNGGYLHIVSVGLEEFNTSSFYLLWESLVEPMNEAVQEYCDLYQLHSTGNVLPFQVLSVDIVDGAIRPEIVLKILDISKTGVCVSNPIIK